MDHDEPEPAEPVREVFREGEDPYVTYHDDYKPPAHDEYHHEPTYTEPEPVQ